MYIILWYRNKNYMKQKKKARIVSYFMILPFIILGQNLDSIKTVYEKEKEVFLNYNKTLRIEKGIGNNLRITEDNYDETFFIKEPYDVNRERNIYYDSFSTIISSYAEVDNRYSQPAHLKRSKQLLKIKDFSDDHYLNSGVFFSDGKLRKVQLTNIYKNTIARLKSKISYKDPHFIPSFSLIKSNHILNAYYTVIVDKEIDVDFKEFNLPKHNYTVDSTGTKIKHQWNFKNIKKTKSISNFSPRYYAPQIYPLIKKVKNGKSNTSFLGSTNNLYEWYYSLLSSAKNSNDQFLKNLSKEITANSTDPIEITEKIYYHVQNKINYIAFEDGMNGFIPRDPYIIYQNKYGDCKDMSYLTYTLLKHAGIDAHMTWVGTRSIPFNYESLPTPAVDNHMICTATINDQIYYLDATAKFLKLGFPSPFIQGKECLIGISKDKHQVEKIPEIPVSKNYLKIESKLNLNEKSLSGSIKFKCTGYQKLVGLHRLQSIENSDTKKINKTYGIASVKVGLNAINTRGLERQQDTLSTSATISISRGIRKIGDQYYIKPFFDFDSFSLISDEESYGKKIEYKYLKEVSTKITAPEGFEISVPKTTTIATQDYSLEINYQLISSREIKISKKLKINTLKINNTGIQEWNKFVKKTIKANKSTIKISKI